MARRSVLPVRLQPIRLSVRPPYPLISLVFLTCNSYAQDRGVHNVARRRHTFQHPSLAQLAQYAFLDYVLGVRQDCERHGTLAVAAPGLHVWP